VLFVELRFFVFFAIVFAVHWSLRTRRSRKAFLLLASYVFYASWDWRFLGLIIGSTLLDWITGKRIHASEELRTKRRWLALSMVGNLSMLAFFKYYGFFATSLADLISWFGLNANLPTLNLILPVGISFYTFQTMSYSLDIYFKKIEPSKELLDVAFFVGFFTQLVAGPIVRASEFLPQLTDIKRWSQVAVRPALVIIFTGFVKKACVGDYFAVWSNEVFDVPGNAGALDIWLGSTCYVVHAYCDFSGYSDMAIGCAALLGYALPLNFSFPYFSRSMGDFWKRWHITLGRWFFSYLYIPLGGSRGTHLRVSLNLVVVFMVAGLWHGSAWVFVLWGLFHSIFIVAERFGLARLLARAPVIVGVLYVNLLWICALSIFRAESATNAFAMFGRMWGASSDDPPGGLLGARVVWLIIAWYFVHWLMYRLKLAERWYHFSPRVFAFTYGAAWALALPWVRTDPMPYIYFAF